MEDLSEYCVFAIEVAREAGTVLMHHYGAMQQLEWKQRTDFKTKVDDLSDKLIRTRIQTRFPTHTILSEENAHFQGTSEYSWVVDPLDGTIPYRYGITDHFSVCIALVREKVPIVGVTYAPLRNELYVSQQGKGATCNGKTIRPLTESNVNKAIIGIDGGKETNNFQRTSITDFYEKLYRPDGVTCLVSSGCASVPIGLVAQGKLHAYLALSLEPWDMAAGVIINQEAGVRVTTLDGRPWTLDEPSLLIANPALHENILELLKR